MASTSESSSGPSTATGRVPLRIRLDNGFQSGHVDGAWWPQSRDLQVEAADLVDHFPHLIGSIERLLFSRPDWDAVAGAPSARRIQAHRGPVKVGSFPSDDTHLMIVKMTSGARLRLLVIPSDTAPAEATRVMDLAADERNQASARELLRLTGADQSGIGFDVWNDDTHAAM
jgi:hypothetical protein